MTNGVATLCAAVAALVVTLLMVRLGGQFIAGHAIRFTRRFAERIKDYRDDA